MTRHPRRVSIWLLVPIVAALVSTAVIGLRGAGLLQRLELVAFDHHMRLAAGDEAPEAHVALLEVTEADIQELGTYPVPDGVLARALEKLDAAGARVIGVDIYRDIPVPPGTEAFESVLLSNRRIVVISKFADDISEGVAPPPALAGTPRVGFNNVVPDPVDGLVRRGLLFMEDAQGGSATSFPLLLSLFYLGAEGIHLTASPDDPNTVALGPSRLPPIGGDVGGYAGIDAEGYQILIDCRGTPRRLPSASLLDLTEGRVDPGLFRDRIVMLGITADSLADRVYFACEPEHNVAGAVLHAHLANQLVLYGQGRGAPVRQIPEAAETLAIVALASLGALLAVVSRSTWHFTVAGFGALCALWLGGWWGLAQGWWLPVVPSGVAGVASASVAIATVSSRERRERVELMNLFSRMVDGRVAREVWRRRDEFLDGGRLRPDRVTATVLFVDMKGYTSRAEKMDPDELMLWLDDYLRELARCILDAGGMIVDYFGDGIMACFGLPIPRRDLDGVREDAQNAVACALAMEESARVLNEQSTRRGRPAIGIRVGITTGVVVAGTVGSTRRIKYSAVGDVVVTAQRLESLDDTAHDFAAEPCRILIGGRTRECLGEEYRVRAIGEFQLKGKADPVSVYRVLGLPDTRAAEHTRLGEGEGL